MILLADGKGPEQIVVMSSFIFVLAARISRRCFLHGAA